MHYFGKYDISTAIILPKDSYYIKIKQNVLRSYVKINKKRKIVNLITIILIIIDIISNLFIIPLLSHSHRMITV